MPSAAAGAREMMPTATTPAMGATPMTPTTSTAGERRRLQRDDSEKGNNQRNISLHGS